VLIIWVSDVRMIARKAVPVSASSLVEAVRCHLGGRRAAGVSRQASGTDSFFGMLWIGCSDGSAMISIGRRMPRASCGRMWLNTCR
jgi:hypothetical protein